MMSSISGCTSTGDSPGANTYSQNGSNWEWRSPEYIGYSDGSQRSPQATQFLYTKQYSNQTGPIEYNCWVRVPLQSENPERFQSKILGMPANVPWYVSNTVIKQQQLKKKYVTTALSTVRLSAHPNDPLNLRANPDTRRLRRHLPNDLPTRFHV
jgi:hypothetical protein